MRSKLDERRALSDGPVGVSGAGAPDQPASVPTTAAAARHPLDPLTPDEIRAIGEVARADARLAQAAFHSVTLHEPAKSEVLAWQPPAVLAREARIQAMTATTTYEVLVDLGQRRLVSVTERPGAEPPITGSEIAGTQAVLENAQFKAALERRGVTDLTKVFCAPFTAGYYGRPEHEGKRLVKVSCFDMRRSTHQRVELFRSSACTRWWTCAGARC